MKAKHNFLYHPMLIAGVLLFFLGSCKKDDDKDVINQIPILSTSEVTKILQITAESGGIITSDGGFIVSERGVCWSTGENPTIKDNKTSDGPGAGSFTSKLNDLTAGTIYYARAYATNSKGTGYGSTMVFQTMGNTFIDSRDGNAYKIITIGDQLWMAENLRYLPSVVGPATGSQATPHYYVYGYSGTNVTNAKTSTNYNTYGVIYNWPAATAACPIGWHLPSDAEWKQLEMSLGMSQTQADATAWRGTDEGGKLKSTTYWNSPNTGATNSSSFTALPGGGRLPDGSFLNVGISGYWWTATVGYSDNYWTRGMRNDKSSVSRYFDNKQYGYSVRCMKD